MLRGWLALALAALAGCSDPEGCRTTQDCFDQGLGRNLECVNSTCVATCAVDGDCRLGVSGSKAVCERGLCEAGCPEVACGGGETCVDGRCLMYFQSFEAATPGGFAALDQLGWNDIPRELRNKSAEVVWSGLPTCTPADRPERCAGPAADGEYFLAVERQKIPPTGTLEFGVTCGACACCRACRDPAARTDAFESSCLGVSYPTVPMCTASPPAECSAICAQCDACPAAPPESIGSGLDACAAQAGRHACAGCDPFDACVRQKVAENRMCPGGNYPACAGNPPMSDGACRECLEKECANLRPACWACRDAAQLKRDFPSMPERWSELEMQCTTQGADGCYTTPINAPRSSLTEDEQALESPVIPLAGIDGDVVLQLLYVPFDIRASYRRVVQGQPPASWPVEPQQVKLQLCGGGCEQSGSWVDAGTFPREPERGNGLQFAAQSKGDWRTSQLEVPIPANLRTATFRFRLLPALEDDARIGVDRVVIRRKK